jgi:HD-GYP domain-containing protein (c-di-GMP phosphodiesterase class II)
VSSAKGPQPIPDTARKSTPLLTPDKSIRHKIAAGSSAREMLDEGIAVLGAQLVTQLNILFKTVRIHDRTNAALQQVLNGLLTTIRSLGEGQAVQLRLESGFLYLGSLHLKVVGQHTAIFFEFIDLLDTKQIGTISMAPDVQAAELRDFAYAFVEFDAHTSTVPQFQERLKEHGIQKIEVKEKTTVTVKIDVRTKNPKELAKHLYLKAVAVVGEVMENIKQRGAPNFRQAKRVIQHVVDLIQQDESAMLGLTTLRCYDEYTHNHSVNVSLLSIAVGKRAQFDKAALVDLGVAALFHDLGKTSLPHELLNKAQELSEDEWRLVKGHPVQGVVRLIRLRGIKNIPARMAAVSFEHHMTLDGAGYPQLEDPWDVSLSGRILMIADAYDGMTSSRVYRRTPLAPHKVLEILLRKRGRAVDSTLLKLFVNCIGVIPIGSLVLLDTRELAVVMRAGEEVEDSARPWVKLVSDPKGEPIEQGPEVDLREQDEAGRYRRSIIRLVDNAEYRFDTSRYFL